MRLLFGRLALAFTLVLPGLATAARLSNTFTASPLGTTVDLSAVGSLDWVHWGPFTEFDSDRKAGVTPAISEFTVIYGQGQTYGPYQQSDLNSGFSWSDGLQNSFVTNTTTGIYVGGKNGVSFTVPAGTATNVLRVYVAANSGSGKITASLSDNSAGPVTATSAYPVEGFYTLVFAAATDDKTLTVTWEGTGNGTVASLQSAALAPLTGNNPPTANLWSPSLNANFPASSTQILQALASDSDGTVSLVEFFSGTNKIGEATAAPFTTTWTNPSAGMHQLTVKATDNLGATYTSKGVTVFAWTNGGSLTGSFDAAPLLVDLTAEGTNDWVHWGRGTAIALDRKDGVVSEIPTFTTIGPNAVLQYADNYSLFSWIDGTPVVLEYGTPTGVFVFGLTNGFSLTLPASRQSRLVKIYAGLFAARGNFQAYLSDASAPPFCDTTLVNIYNNAYRVYTLNYAAASSNQSLTIHYTALNSHDTVSGNITLQAATLSLGPVPLAETITITDPIKTDELFSFTFPTDAGAAYQVFRTDCLQPPDWTLLTNFVGDGNVQLITDSESTATNRFYRVFRP